MQVFFELALSRSPNGNLTEYARAIMCLTTTRLYLEGEARTYYQKQIAQEAVLPLAREYGVEIKNNIQVKKD